MEVAGAVGPRWSGWHSAGALSSLALILWQLLEILLVLRGREAWYAGEGKGSPLQYSCLENSMDGKAWQATVHGVTESQPQLSN